MSNFTTHDIGLGKGAGAGGGLGLNAPGAGPKVRHFAAGGGKASGPTVAAEVESAWQAIVNDDDATHWMLATCGRRRPGEARARRLLFFF